MFADVGDLVAHIQDDIRIGAFHMTIAHNLSWELVALSDSGSTNEAQRTALEVAYGVSLTFGDQPDLFSACMSGIVEQVTDQELKRHLRQAVAHGLRK